jgi:pyruvate kinase
LSEKDKKFVRFAAEEDIDFIAHSFVRDKEDVQALQDLLDEYDSDIKIIAKIENKEGVDNVDEILEKAYGLMVARGDLAIEIPYTKIPGIQNDLVEKCIVDRKPVIVATQMLQSMIEQPRPTRAEVTDIAHAIFNKADAIMLSGETAYGKYPKEAVSTMAAVAEETEKSISDMHDTPYAVLSTEISAYLSMSAVEASVTLDIAAIIADTRTGRTIRNMAAYRGKKIIYAQCYDKRTVRRLALSFGVCPAFHKPEKYKKFLFNGLKDLLRKKELDNKDKIVVIGGNFDNNNGATFIEISKVKDLIIQVSE